MRGMLLMIREGRHCEQAFRSDMGRHYVLRTSYLRRVCRSYGAVFLRVVAKIIFRAWYEEGAREKDMFIFNLNVDKFYLV